LGVHGQPAGVPFFYFRGDVDAVETLLLDCYRLAKYYGRNPREFLHMPFSEIQRHVSWTTKLEQTLRPDDDAD
jgi:hypothetical protein